MDSWAVPLSKRFQEVASPSSLARRPSVAAEAPSRAFFCTKPVASKSTLPTGHLLLLKNFSELDEPCALSQPLRLLFQLVFQVVLASVLLVPQSWVVRAVLSPQ